MPRPPGPPRGKGSETATVRAILDYLRVRGHIAFRMNSRVVMLPGKGEKLRPYRMGGVKGMADIVGSHWRTVRGCGGPQCPDVLEAVPFAIEVKSATGKPTPEQTAFLAYVARAGWTAFIARSVKDVQEHGL